MSNHVHFAVHGVEKDCRAFIVAYKKRLSLIADVGMAGICVKQIDTDDYLLRVIGYVLRNPVGAGLGVMPQFYRWSSASLYFNKDRVVDGITVEDVGTKKMRGILRSHYRLPSDYIVTTDGMVDPSCYVDYRAVEGLFGHVGRMLYFLSRNDDWIRHVTWITGQWRASSVMSAVCCIFFPATMIWRWSLLKTISPSPPTPMRNWQSQYV